MATYRFLPGSHYQLLHDDAGEQKVDKFPLSTG
jgi:hypothetical protein